MRNTLLLSLFILFTLLVIGASGCQQSYTQTNVPVSDNNSVTPPVVPSAASSGEVIIKNFAFTPSEITIAKGGKITFVNQDSVEHTVTSDTQLFDLKIMPGTSSVQSFDIAGTYDYHCSIHTSMQGKIVVQ